jgi:DNA-binding MarR family transcriptional regulator
MKMHVFEYLQQMRAFERRHLPFVRTMEDLNILYLIGLHQERGTPLTLKQILSFGIGSAATLERRLARLKRLGVVVQARSQIDRRNVELKLSPKISRVFQRYATLIVSSNQTYLSEQASE